MVEPLPADDRIQRVPHGVASSVATAREGAILRDGAEMRLRVLPLGGVLGLLHVAVEDGDGLHAALPRATLLLDVWVVVTARSKIAACVAP